ncbi:hypothetical protein A2841_02545 [Candidatus Kaiserbacteria bacterium RIFCSPHIGHO2_01_FULL_48_10]|uniref:ABC transporter substrate-binding protein n=1 Tax=Candidatus Kaiserbacteria bacterium RIFCSPHIGHO2_01_FULL_48_10 TaxID=1798476 RepID=A0A1F6C325_9BACT|nr:MAG: hypothetical protein A2841_02545 [Candidatus Kaiserbacteria bacterium RIFCSPHIGHO2_01_FULL_48_10]
MKPFHTIVLGIFLVLALLAVVVFATFSSSGGKSVGTVEVWGALPEQTMNPLVEALKTQNQDFSGVEYRAFPKDQLISELVEAIAKGAPPDLVLFPAESLVQHADKIQTISYTRLSRRDFQDTFVQAGEVFLGADGFKGFPFFVDPLVMYWNRSLFAEAAVARPPKYWDELSEATPKLTKKDERGGVTQSAVALGSWTNVVNAKAIFLSLLSQLGNPVIVRTESGFKSVLSSAVTSTAASGDSALRFYTEFADPVKSSYSWNRSRPDSRTAFVSGTLAIYFGRASELTTIRAQNPNLNFDVAPVPATREGRSGGEAAMSALSVPRGARNPEGAILAAQALSGVDMQKALMNSVAMPSVRRDALSASPANPYAQTFNNAALSSVAFLDPSPQDSDSIFSRMVERVLSGQLRVGEAVRSADAELAALLH